MTLQSIIIGIIALAFGLFIGAAWGISRHVELIDWLEARTISRWMQAMQSLGYEQWRIDMVLSQMGQRIMVNIPPPPEPPVKKPSLDYQLRKLHICAAWHWTVAEEDKTLVQQLCINYSDMLHNVAKRPSRNEDMRMVEDSIYQDWMQQSNHDYGLRTPSVTVNLCHYDEDGVIWVLFEIR